MRFNCWQLARAWNSVALASGEDKSRPALFRTVLIEMFPEGVRLIATDSFILLKAWIPTVDDPDADEPGRDELPEESTVCMDRDLRVVGLMRYAQKETKADGADTPITLSLTIGTMKPGQQGTLDGMVQQTVSFHFDHEYDERIETPIFDGNYPAWKNLWYAHQTVPTSMVSFGADGFLRLGKLSALWDKAAIRFAMGGSLGVAKFSIIAPDVNVEGLAMPVSDGRPDRMAEPVAASDEGIHFEYSEALDEFLADVLRTEVPHDGDDEVVDAALRAQLVRAGQACIDAGNGTIELLVAELGVDAEHAWDLLVKLIAAEVLAPLPEGEVAWQKCPLGAHPQRALAALCDDAPTEEPEPPEEPV